MDAVDDFRGNIHSRVEAEGHVGAVNIVVDGLGQADDVDAVRTVSNGVKIFRERVHGSLLIITHSTRILEALTVDETHVMENGVIVRSGGAELVEEINSNGFAGV